MYAYEDRNGYGRFTIAETSKTNKALMSFKTEPEAFHRLKEIVEKYTLCPRLAGVQYTDAACHGLENTPCKGACTSNEPPKSYNERYAKAKIDVSGAMANFVLTEKGRHENEYGAVLVEQGRFKGFGHITKDIPVADVAILREHISPAYDDQDMQYILRSWSTKKGIQKINY